ncbi:MAG: DUF433 domain-containing protein [Dehalococcoidia bacterium]
MKTLTLHPPPLPLAIDADGVVRVAGTRIPIDMVIYAYTHGDTAEEIVQQYDVLQLADVYAVISYFLRNQGEVEAYLREREREADIIRREMEARFTQDGIKARLLARRPRSGHDQ